MTHPVSQYVNGMAHTNGIESFWAALNRGYHGTFQHISPKHLQRYVNEFTIRHNLHPLNTATVTGEIVVRMVVERLTYAAPTANVLPGSSRRSRQCGAVVVKANT